MDLTDAGREVVDVEEVVVGVVILVGVAEGEVVDVVIETNGKVEVVVVVEEEGVGQEVQQAVVGGAKRAPRTTILVIGHPKNSYKILPRSLSDQQVEDVLLEVIHHNPRSQLARHKPQRMNKMLNRFYFVIMCLHTHTRTHTR